VSNFVYLTLSSSDVDASSASASRAKDRGDVPPFVGGGSGGSRAARSSARETPRRSAGVPWR